jgi:hypothetical protein
VTLVGTCDGKTGDVDVVHENFAYGCCPSWFDVTATLVTGDDDIEISYDVGPDLCDCYCPLTATYTLEAVPDGTWTRETATMDADATCK